MDKNYYDVLSLKRYATEQQIIDSYRKLVQRWHPKFAKEDQNTSHHHFSEISEAYEVLSDPLKRAFYDKYGYTKLKEGLFMQGELKGGYRFANNPDEIFQKFFLSNNVLAKCLDQKVIQKGSIFSSAFGALNYKDTLPKDDLEVTVPCTLSELYQGVAKKSSFARKVLNLDGQTLKTEHVQKLLQIKAGTPSNAVIIYEHQGNQNISRQKANLIFKIQEIPHQLFSRNGNDLVYTAHITLAEALSCSPIQIRTLDNRVLRVSLDQIPNPQQLKQLEGQGMPIPSTQKKGNLFIKFDIKFPKAINQQTKQQLRNLLK